MQGDSNIIHLLNMLLADELTSADQYFVHSQMYQNWGYRKLGERIEHERQEEMTHASKLIERILFLGGVPNAASRNQLAIGQSIPEMLENDLTLEYKVAKALREVMSACEKAHDYVTRDILLTLLNDTERDHTHWLEQQVRLIKAVGLQNYLQSQM